MSFAITAAAVLSMLPLLSAVGIHPFRNCVAMNAECGGGVRNAFLVSRVGFLDIELFEFLKSFIEQNMAVEHVFDYGFEAGANLHL
jgi:hypothetical protein